MPTPERLNPVMDVSEDAQSPSLYPREKQYFEFCPVEFVDNVYNAVGDYISDGIDAFEKALVKEIGFSTELHQGSERLYTLMRSVFDRNFDKFEIYLLRNIFQIPADFVFLHDQPPIPFYDTTTTQSNEASTTPSTESSDIGAPTEQQIDDELINLQRELELERERMNIMKADRSVFNRNMRSFGVLMEELSFVQNMQPDTMSRLKDSGEKAQKLIHLVDKIKELQIRLNTENVLRQKEHQNALSCKSDLESISQYFEVDSSTIRYTSTQDIQAFLQTVRPTIPTV